MLVANYFSNKDIRLEEVKIPSINEKEVLVEVIASGICGSDLMQWYKKDNLPKVLGHETSGKIIEVGDRNSKIQLITDNNFSVSVKVGDNISIGQFRPTYYRFGVLDGIIKSLDIKEGNTVFTSGVSEIYPPDIPIAKIKSQIKKKNKLKKIKK